MNSRYAPNNAVVGEMGWNPPSERLWRCVFRQWRRLSIMLELRLNARVHAWARLSALCGTKNDSYKVAPIRLETGRYENLPEEQRLCPMSDSQAI